MLLRYWFKLRSCVTFQEKYEMVDARSYEEALGVVQADSSEWSVRSHRETVDTFDYKNPFLDEPGPLV